MHVVLYTSVANELVTSCQNGHPTDCIYLFKTENCPHPPPPMFSHRPSSHSPGYVFIPWHQCVSVHVQTLIRDWCTRVGCHVQVVECIQ